MAITYTTDPILDVIDAESILGVSDPTQLAMLVNGVSAKFLAYTNRVKINYDGTTALVEKIKAVSGHRLYLHASPVTADGTHDITVAIYIGGVLESTYLYSEDAVTVYSSDTEAWLEMSTMEWPDTLGRQMMHVTYFGGFSTIPGDVVQGAVLQAKADLRRMQGEVGVTSKSREGESTSYDNAGVIKTVRDIWAPYRILV